MQTRGHIVSQPIGREMTDNECRCRIREASTARLRLLDQDSITAVDVTYSVDGNTVMLRPSDESHAEALPDRANALLEIDHETSEARSRWRVVVTGLVEPVAAVQSRTTPPAGQRSDDAIELRIHSLEGRHGVPEALPPGSLIPPPRQPGA